MKKREFLSKTAFSRAFIRGLPFVVPQFLIVISLFVTSQIYSIIEFKAPTPELQLEGPEEFFSILDSFMLPAGSILPTMLLCGVIFGIILFKFINSKAKMNIYYSLGIRRTSLFGSVYLAGAALLIIPTALPIIINALINVGALGSSSALWSAEIYVILILYAFTMLGFSVTAVCMATTGTLLEGAVDGFILATAPFWLGRALSLLSRRFLNGSAFDIIFDSQFFMTKPLPEWEAPGEVTINLIPDKFNPFLISHRIFDPDYLSPNKEDYKIPPSVWDIEGATFSVIFIIVLSVILAVCAVHLFKRRKAEFCGIPGANKALNLTAVFIFGTYIYSIIAAALPLRNFVAALIAFIIFAVFCILFNSLMEHSFKRGVRNWKFTAMPVGALCAVIIIFATGAFGYSSYVPKADEVVSARITSVGADSFNENLWNGTVVSFASAGGRGRVSSVYGRETPLFTPSSFTILDETETDKVIELHKKLIKNEGYKRDYNFYEPVCSRDLAISYTLKSGKTVTRYFRNCNDECIDKAILLQYNNYFRASAENDLRETLYGDDYDLTVKSRFEKYGQKAVLTDEQKETLISAVHNDLYKKTPEEHFFPDTPVQYYFAYDYKEDNETSVVNGNVIASTDESNKKANPFLAITPDMESTYALLREWGYLSDINSDINIDEIKEIDISPENNLINRNDFIPFFTSNVIGSWSSDFGEEIYEDKSKVTTITDKNEIVKILNEVQLMHPTTRGGYQVHIKLKTANEYSEKEFITAYLPEEV